MAISTRPKPSRTDERNQGAIIYRCVPPVLLHQSPRGMGMTAAATHLDMYVPTDVQAAAEGQDQVR